MCGDMNQEAGERTQEQNQKPGRKASYGLLPGSLLCRLLYNPSLPAQETCQP